jgi:hypothetical protein
VPVRFIYWKDMVEHAKTVRKINNIGFGKSGEFIDNTGEVGFVGMSGGQVGEGVEVAVEGIDLLLDRGEVNRNSDVDVGHVGGDSADGVKDNVVVMVGEGGSEVLGGRVDKESGKDQTGENGRSEKKMGSDHLSGSAKGYLR